jgi:hypothetical protein
MRMASRRPIIALGLALSFLATSALTGCSPFAAPEPPPVVTAAVDAALADFRGTVGVAEASGYASLIDSAWGGAALKDPDSWIARFEIAADPQMTDVAGLAVDIDEILRAARSTLISAAGLDLPAAGTAAAATLGFTSDPVALPVEDMVAAAIVLRELEGAEELSISTYPTPAQVRVAGAEHWTDAAAELRAIPGFGVGALRAVSLSTPLTDDGINSGVTIDAISPSPSLIAAFADLETTSGVRSASLDGVRAFDLVDEDGRWRPSMSLSTDTDAQGEDLAARLLALPDAVTAVAGVPRTAFSISDKDMTFTASGFIGLPLGSAAPDDGVPTASVTSTPPPVDPALAATRLEEGRARVASLLDEAGDHSGIRGVPSFETVVCADDLGAQISGSVVVPIFEIADSADDALASITEAWLRRGYEYTDRAMGTDAYAAHGFESLTIRGTAEGIRIMATANCNV